MKKLLFIWLAWVVIGGLSAQNNKCADMSALLENKVWKVQLPQNKQYAMEMEFRDAGWRSVFLYDGKRKETFYSYSLCGDTIKVFESRKNYIIQELTDSTLVFQYLPDTLTIGVGPVRCMTDNSLQGQRQNENRLDSIWCAEIGWNIGVLDMSGSPIKDLSTIEPPRWAKWNYDLEKYYTSQMVYPEELLKKNQAGYSVVMFYIDTLGLPHGIYILTSKHKEFDKEVIRLRGYPADQRITALSAMQGQGRQANEMLLCGLCAFPATTLPRQGEGGQYRGRRTETLFCRMGGCLFFPKRQAVFCAKLHHPTLKV